MEEISETKLGIVDVLAELNDDTKINIELQIKVIHNWDKRQLYYLCRVYGEELGRGEDYGRLKKCMGISILDFNLSDRQEYYEGIAFIERVCRLRQDHLD